MFKAGQNLSNEELIHLTRFYPSPKNNYGLGSRQLIASSLVNVAPQKSRGAFPIKNQFNGSKQNSSNKFLPYGNILDFS